MAKKKRKISKYNRHVAAEMKKGKSMSEAAKSWNKKKSPSKKTTSKKKTSKSRKQITQRRRRKPRGQKKPMFPLVNKILFQGGPVRQKIRAVIGR